MSEESDLRLTNDDQREIHDILRIRKRVFWATVLLIVIVVIAVTSLGLSIAHIVYGNQSQSYIKRICAAVIDKC